MSSDISCNYYKLLFGDCLARMNDIANESVNLILCDLPYGVTSNKWDSIIPIEDLWNQYNRIINKNGVIVLTAIQPFASYLINSNPTMFKYDIVWKKNKVTGHLNAKKMPLRAHEYLLVFYNKLPIYNPQKTFGHKPVNKFTHHSSGTTYNKYNFISGGGQTDRYPTSIIEFDVVNNDSKEKIHPSQKPVDLCEWVVLTYSNKNNVVLDSCMGSASTGIACINTERFFIGIENDIKFFSSASKRISEHLALMVKNE